MALDSKNTTVVSAFQDLSMSALSDEEIVRLSGLFDAQWYLNTYRDVAEAGIDPLQHYLQIGGKEGRDPALFFDTKAYFRAYPEVQESAINPLVHWLRRETWDNFKFPTRVVGPSDEELLRFSGLFDPDWYLEMNPDVAEAGRDPWIHYLGAGAAEGRRPSRTFDVERYLRDNPDVAASRANPVVHWLTIGRPEGRTSPVAAPGATDEEILRFSGLFDPDWYLETNPDVAKAGRDPWIHYLGAGAAEGRRPSRAFDVERYLRDNPDVAASRANPVVHWLTIGKPEGRTSPVAAPGATDEEILRFSGLFDPDWYLATNPDVAEAGWDPWIHYLGAGAVEGRRPSRSFDVERYLRDNPDVAASRANPVVHWVRIGKPEGRTSPVMASGATDEEILRFSGLFDPDWYLATNPDVAEAGWDPWIHYLGAGAVEGRRPSRSFDVERYLRDNPDVAASRANPLVHWLRIGKPEGRTSPLAEAQYDDETLVLMSGLFDGEWYLKNNPDVARSNMDPLRHYLASGWRENRKPSHRYDIETYLNQVDDPIAREMNPLVYWLRVGALRAGLAPLQGGLVSDEDLIRRSGLFDETWYLGKNPDVAAANADAATHYLSSGAQEGRQPSPVFDAGRYTAQYSDVRETGENPLLHWIKKGLREGRKLPVPSESAISLDDLCSIEPGPPEFGAGSIVDDEFFVSILTPTFNTRPAHLEALFRTIRNQIFGSWEWVVADDGSTSPDTLAYLRQLAASDLRVRLTCPGRGGISNASNAALRVARGSFVALVDHDDLLPRKALFHVYRAWQNNRDADFFYTDECKLTEDERIADIFLKPSWSPIYLENTMYVGHMGVYRAKLLERIGGFRSAFDGTQDFDLALRAGASASQVVHVSEIGYIWRMHEHSTAKYIDQKDYVFDRQQAAVEEHVHRFSPQATVSEGWHKGYWNVHYPLIQPNPLLSYVIATAGSSRVIRGERIDLLMHCITSLIDSRFYDPVEFVIIHNGDLRQEQLTFLSNVPNMRLVEYSTSGIFNMSDKYNLGVANATGEYICLVNDDIEIVTERGGERLVALLQAHPEVGAAAPLCLFEHGEIQHNGMLLVDNGPTHGGIFKPANFPGHFGNLRCRRESFGVTGALMVTPRALYEKVGGFSPTFKLNYNDVDYCLKLAREGFSRVVDPYVSIFHFEASSKNGTFPCEKELLVSVWPDMADTYYNRRFDTRRPFYEIASGQQSLRRIDQDADRLEIWINRRIAQRVRTCIPSGQTKLTVGVPIYNQTSSLLNEVLLSIQLQTYSNYELIVVDDASTDPQTIAWIDRLSEAKTCTVIRHLENRGIAGANRTILEHASGEFLLLVDADDFLTIDALQVMAWSIERQPNAHIFYSDEFFSNIVSQLHSPFFKPDYDPILLTNCCYPTHLMAHRVRFLREIEAYSDDRATWCHDYDVLTRAVSRGVDPVHVRELLYAWRIIPGSTASEGYDAKPQTIDSQIFVLARLLVERGLSDVLRVDHNELVPHPGMWRLRMVGSLPPVVVFKLSELLSLPWSTTRSILGTADADGTEWIAILAEPDEGSNTLSELFAVALYDKRICAVGGVVRSASDGALLWGGGFFAAQGCVVDPHSGEKDGAPGYHGALWCQRCVDVIAPGHMLVRRETLMAALSHDAVTNLEALVVRIGLDAQQQGLFVAITPHAAALTSRESFILPLDREGQLGAAMLAGGRWYNAELPVLVEDAYGILDEADLPTVKATP